MKNMLHSRENNLKDKIVSAAVKDTDGKLYLGARHGIAYTVLYVNTGRSYNSSLGIEDGFVTAEGKFLNRSQAYKLAVESFQTINDISLRRDKDLYSEDLW